MPLSTRKNPLDRRTLAAVVAWARACDYARLCFTPKAE
jgi:hypothetical protein